MLLPSFLNSFINSNKTSVSCKVIEAVGSSKINILKSLDIALAISIICCLATESSPTKTFLLIVILS